MSVLLTMLANINRDPKKSRPAKPADFNPHLTKRTKRLESLSEIKEFFIPKDHANAKAVSLGLSMPGATTPDSGFGRAEDTPTAGDQ